MKRLISLLIVLVLCLSLAACGKKTEDPKPLPENTATDTPAPSATTAPEPTVTDVPEPTAEPTAAPTPEPTNAPAPEAPILTVTTTNVDREDFVEADLAVSYDTISVENSGFEALEKTLSGIGKYYEDYSTGFAESFLPDMVYVDDEVSCYIECSADIYRADENVVSISYADSTYLGGAHPSYTVRSYNIDTNTGEIINILDLFGGTVYSTEWDNFRTALLYELENSENADEFYPEYRETVDGILFDEASVNDMLTWFYGVDSISVLFNQYVIAPYVAGVTEVIIPYEYGHIAYPENTEEELLGELSGTWKILYSEVDGYSEVYGLGAYGDLEDTTSFGSVTVNTDGTVNYTEGGEVLFENAPIHFGSWMDAYNVSPAMSTFNIDYTDGENYFYGAYDGENLYLTHEIDVPDYHVAVYMVFVQGEPTFHEAYAALLSSDGDKATIALKDYKTLVSWDDPDYLASFGLTKDNFDGDYIRYLLPGPAHRIEIDSLYPPIMNILNYEDLMSYRASYEDFIQNLSAKASWNDYMGPTVIYINGLYGPVYICESYEE